MALLLLEVRQACVGSIYYIAQIDSYVATSSLAVIAVQASLPFHPPRHLVEPSIGRM